MGALLLWEESSPWSAGTAVDGGPDDQKGENISVTGTLGLRSHQTSAAAATSCTPHFDWSRL